MATAHELERLVVKLVGEGSNYKKVLDDAVRQTDIAAKKIDQTTKLKMAAQNRAMQEAARITDAVKRPTEKYAEQLRRLGKHLSEGRISQETYRRAVVRLKAELPAQSRAMQEAARITDAAKRPAERYAEQVRKLDRHLKTGRITQETYRRAVAGLRAELPEAQRAQARYNRDAQRAAEVMRQVRTPASAYKRQVAELHRLHRKGHLSAGAYGRAISQLRSKLPEVQRAQERHNQAMRRAAEIIRQARTPTQRYRRELAELNRLHRMGAITAGTHAASVRRLQREYVRGAHAAAAFGGRMMGAGRRMRGMGMIATFAVTAPVIAMIRSFGQFDDAMTKSTAIMGGMTAELRAEMERTARVVARDSVTSATELARSYYYLASAGMNARQSIAALPVVERFAVAGAFDMAQATDLLTDAQSALGLSSKDATENMQGMLRVSDVLVKANTLANASVQQFSEALTNNAGPAIKQYDMDLTEGVAILAAYADQGLKAAAAGSMFGRAVRLLIKGINENRETFAKMNIDVTEFAATGKNLTGIIEDLTRAVEGMGPAEKAAALEALGFQARTQQAILPLLGLADKIRGYRSELDKAGGTTETVANRQLGSFISQLKILWNRIKEVADEIGKYLAPYVLKLGEYISAAMVYWRGLSDSTKSFLSVVIGIAAVLGPLLILFGAIAVGVGGLVSVIGTLGSISLAALIPILVIAAKVALVVAAVVAVGYALKRVAEYIWGPGSVSAAFKHLWNISLTWAKKIIGFIANIGYNFNVLMEWLPNNWQNVVQDMITLWGLYVMNSIHNIEVLITTIVRLWALWQGWMTGMFKRVFTVEFWKWAWEGIKKVGKAILDFGAATWRAIKGIFTGGGDREGLQELIKTVTDDFQEGMSTTDLAASAAGIIREQADKLRSPFEGFESSLEELPKFKTDLEIGIDKAGLQKDVEDAVGKARPPAIDVGAGAPGGEAERRRTDFQQIALNRLAVQGLVGFRAERKQAVEAKGVETRLDTLIQVVRASPGLALTE